MAEQPQIVKQVRVNDILANMFRKSNEAQQAASQLGDLIDQLIQTNAALDKKVKELEEKLKEEKPQGGKKDGQKPIS